MRLTAQGKARARSLAARCRVLRQSLLESGECDDPKTAGAAAERRAFGEFLRGEEGPGADWAYVYEEFLRAFAPELRRAQGVYYTPAEVVRAQVRLAADLLERRMSCGAAFADPRVLVVDPAAGSGAYPLAVLEDAVARSGRVPDTLARRMHLLEPMAGAASIARARLAAAFGDAEGLQVEERDALEAQLTLTAPIVVCVGNPPYKRDQAHAPRDRRSMLEDFFEPSGGLHAKNLYNTYVYFWRWALRQVFEQRSGRAS